MWAPAGGLLGPRAGLRALLCGRDAALLPGRARALHGSAVACGSKNLLKKFASKSKKKFWYEGPSLGSHLTHKPSKLDLLVQSTSKKTRKEDHVRLRALNGLLYKALSDLLCTPEVSQEVCDLNLELSKVSLTSDFSACRVYWKTTLSAERNAHAQAVLQRTRPHLLVSNVVLLLFYPSRDPDGPPLCDTEGLATHSSLCGIDHQALNRQIMEYKRRREGRLGAAAGPGPAAELAKPMVKGKKKARPRAEQDSSLRSYLAGEDDLDDAPGPESHPQDSEEEWEADRGGRGTDHGRGRQ
uniref:Ribosome binding factor A n=1 Tax=Microcebus murinus TaxID=30608 RepID=A0A8C5V2W4_MICMU